jgi:hypothetical protein
VLVASANLPGLPGWVEERAAGGRACILLTDDQGALPPLPASVQVVEPEELLPGGVAPIEEAWDRGVRAWLDNLFPGQLGGVSLTELLWFATFRQARFLDRISGAAVALAVLETGPSEVHLARQRPPYTEVIAVAARSRGLPVHQDGDTPGPARAWMQRARFAATALGSMAANAGRLFTRVAARRRALATLPPPARAALAAGEHAGREPAFWIVPAARWYQPSRHLFEAVARVAERLDVPYGMLLTVNLGEEGGDTEEPAVFDGTRGTYRPAILDQASGCTTGFEAVALLARWLPAALAACGRVLLRGDQLAVDGVAVGELADLRDLLRVATQDLLRVMDSEQAARAFVGRHPRVPAAIFGLAAHGELKVLDAALQRAGTTTFDFVHAHVGESDQRTTFRSLSRHLCAWTSVEVARFIPAGTNRYLAGGFMPRPLAGARRTGTRPVILAATSYLSPHPEVRRRTQKHAGRLAAALQALQAWLGDRGDVILRPHPVEDRQRWRELLGTSRVQLSGVRLLSDDLARSSCVIVTNSSAIIEALAYDVAVLFHQGPVVEPHTLVAAAAAVRRFGTGDELIAATRLALEGDRAPERALKEACFGPTLQPASFFEYLQGQLPGVLPAPSRNDDERAPLPAARVPALC